tara:strand:- start:11972 stop:12127 length:156 start_codon:yes stop_codon:yes gene_type:complete
MVKSGVAITEDNVVQEAEKYTERTIESYEKNLLLAKVGQVYERLGIKVNDE